MVSSVEERFDNFIQKKEEIFCDKCGDKFLDINAIWIIEDTKLVCTKCKDNVKEFLIKRFRDDKESIQSR